MNTIIEKIRAEVERRIKSWQTRGEHSPEGQGKDTCVSRVTELTDLLSFLDTLEKEEKPTTAEGLEEEIERVYAEDKFTTRTRASYSIIARHFYELGRQSKPNGLSDEDEKTRKELIGQVIYIIPDNSECDNEGNVLPDYEKRIDKYIDFLKRISKPKVCEDVEEEILNSYDDSLHERWTKCPYTIFQDIARHFAQWGAEHAREQMMKGAVEGWVSSTKGDHFGCVTSVPTDLGKLYGADKCKIIIVKED